MVDRDRLLIPRSLVGLIAAPAVVRAESLMPIVMGKPTFSYTSHGGGMGPWVTCRKDDLLGVSLNLPPGHDWNGHSEKWYWRPDNFPRPILTRIWAEQNAKLAYWARLHKEASNGYETPDRPPPSARGQAQPDASLYQDSLIRTHGPNCEGRWT